MMTIMSMVRLKRTRKKTPLLLRHKPKNKINNVFTIALSFNNYTVTVSFFFLAIMCFKDSWDQQTDGYIKNIYI